MGLLQDILGLGATVGQEHFKTLMLFKEKILLSFESRDIFRVKTGQAQAITKISRGMENCLPHV